MGIKDTPDSDLTRQEKWYGYISQSKQVEESIDSDTLLATSRMRIYPLIKISWTLRLAVSSVCVLFLCLGVSYAWAVYVGNREWISLALPVVLISTGVFLWTLKAWARKLALFVLAVIVVLVPIGMASSGIFLEFWSYYPGRLPLRIVAFATTLIIVVPIFWCMYILNKYKETFS